MPQRVTSAMIQALLRGETPAPEIAACDQLDLSSYGEPDLRFADPERLAPLFAHPAVKRIRHLSMAEGAAESLEAVLGWLEPDTLETLELQTTEAYSGATDGRTMPLIAASPATRCLRALSFDRTGVYGIEALARSPLRQLESLSLMGPISASELEALGGEAPALESVRRLLLTPDRLTPATARAIAASPCLARLEQLELPLYQSGGIDWNEAYVGEGFLARFPASLAALQAMPGLQRIRVTAPGGADELELGAAVQIAMIEALGGGAEVRFEDGLLVDVLELVHGDREGMMEWAFFDTDALPPIAGWIERLHRSGAAAALGVEQPAPSEVDAEAFDEIVDSLERLGYVDPIDIELDGLLERWGEAALLDSLAARGVEELTLLRCEGSGGATVVAYMPEVRSVDEARSVPDLEHLTYHLGPDKRPDQARTQALVDRIGVERACAMYEELLGEALSLEQRDGVWLAFEV